MNMNLTFSNKSPWTQEIYKKVYQKEKKNKDIKYEFETKRTEVYYHLNNYSHISATIPAMTLIHQIDELNQQEKYAISMNNAIYVKKLYSYLQSKLLKIYSFDSEFQKVLENSTKRIGTLKEDIELMLKSPYCEEKDKIFIEHLLKELDGFGKVGNIHILEYGPFIKNELKEVFCDDIVNHICKFI